MHVCRTLTGGRATGWYSLVREGLRWPDDLCNRFGVVVTSYLYCSMQSQISEIPFG